MSEFHSRPVTSRMQPTLRTSIFAAAEMRGRIPDGTIKLFWPGQKPLVESHHDALLRSIEEAARYVLMARINSSLSTSKQVRKKLQKLASSLARARNDFKGTEADDLAMLELVGCADRFAEGANGHPQFTPRVIAASEGEGFVAYDSFEFLMHFGSALDHVSKIAGATAQMESRASTHSATAARSQAEGVILAAMSETDQKNAALRMIYFAWVHVLKRRATTTVDPDTGIEGGPFLEFATKITEILGFIMIPGQIRPRLRRMGYLP